MKIAWFTPLEATSAIGACSRMVVEELSRHCEVDVWTHGEGHAIPGVKLVRFDPESGVLDRLSGYDHCVYNMGNYHRFHAAIFDALKAHPGIVVMHDFVMHHFFMVEYLHRRRTPDLYIAEMERSYGDRGRDAARRSLSGQAPAVWLTDEVARYPLFERIADHATAIFVHSDFHRAHVQNTFVGDVGSAYLPYQASTAARDRLALARAFDFADDKVLALSTGIVHPVKRIENVLRVLSASPQLASRLMYVVIGDGETEYRSKLQAQALEFGIADSVRFLGYQPPEVLRDFLAASDFAINLRFPNSEGCSLSLIEQMAHGSAVIAFDSGMYREMPASAVMKIPVTDSTDALALAMDTMTFDAALRAKMGREASSFADANFRVDTYASKLLDLLSSQRERSYHPLRQSLGEIAAALSSAKYPADRGTFGMEQVLAELQGIVDESAESAAVKSLSTLGVWLGFEHETPLQREGMTRFLAYLLQHLIERHGIDCEIWCYSFNELSIQQSFKNLLANPRTAAKVRIVHEKNCASVLFRPGTLFEPEVRIEKNNLYELANAWSHADCFLLGICYLDNALPLAKPVFIPLHDLVVLENYRTFVGENEDFRPYARKIREAVEQFNRRDAFFFCNSEHVKRRQLMKYIRHVAERRTAVVYLPANVPAGIHDRIATEAEVRERFGISSAYYFYPTQIRHHKNVLTLLKALKQVIDAGMDVQLVLTGSPDHVAAVSRYIAENGLDTHVVLANDVSEDMLYALHAYAIATAVPTLFEGGFPWQALEAMLMDTPAILSRIEAVTERLAAMDINPKGLCLFDPMDVDMLASHLREALVKRAELVRQQSAVKQALFRYDWNNVADAYYRIINERLRAAAPVAGQSASSERHRVEARLN